MNPLTNNIPLLTAACLLLLNSWCSAGEMIRQLDEQSRSLNWQVITKSALVFHPNKPKLEVMSTLNPGDQVRPVQEWEGWYLIQLEADRQGWIKKSDIYGYGAKPFPDVSGSGVGPNSSDSTPADTTANTNTPSGSPARTELLPVPSGAFVLQRDTEFQSTTKKVQYQITFDKGQVVNVTDAIRKGEETLYNCRPVIGGQLMDWYSWVNVNDLKPYGERIPSRNVDPGRGTNTTQESIPREPVFND